MTPRSRNAAQRAFAEIDGTVNLDFYSETSGEPVKNFVAHLSQEAGRQIDLMAHLPNDQYIFHRVEAGQRIYNLRFLPSEITLYPGTYEVRIEMNGKEIFRRSLTVSNHPALP